MPRTSLLHGFVIGLGVLLGLQYAWKQLGPLPFVIITAILALLLGVAYLVETNHPIAPKLSSHPLTGWLVKLICRVRGIPIPAPPVKADTVTSGGPALRTAADFDRLAQELPERIIGQDVAIQTVVSELRRRITLRAATANSSLAIREPLATVSLLGSEGQGKRSLLEAIAAAIYPDGPVCIIDLLTATDLYRPIANTLTRAPGCTIVVEHLEAAATPLLHQLRTILETGELRDPNGVEPNMPLVGAIIGLTSTDPQLATRLGSMFPTLNHAVRFVPPTTDDVVNVVVQLMDQECQRYGIVLDYVDEKVVADLAARHNAAEGYRLVEALIRRRLAPEIQAALDTDHRRLSILE